MVKTQCIYRCGLGSIPGWGTKIPKAMQGSQKAKTKKHNHSQSSMYVAAYVRKGEDKNILYI